MVKGEAIGSTIVEDGVPSESFWWDTGCHYYGSDVLRSECIGHSSGIEQQCDRPLSTANTF